MGVVTLQAQSFQRPPTPIHNKSGLAPNSCSRGRSRPSSGKRGRMWEGLVGGGCVGLEGWISSSGEESSGSDENGMEEGA